jgi:3-hydroxybutyryl-CoA dehydrogenase
MTAPTWPAHAGVIGGGRMGSGVAHAFLTRGIPVTVMEADPEREQAATDAVRRAVEASAKRGTLAEPAEAVLARLATTTAATGLAGCGLVVEAVPEIPDLKASVLHALSAAVAADAIIASNTSSLSITELADHVDRPERFIGMHFFNPVPASQLVEVVVGRRTDASTVEAVRGAVDMIGKRAIVVQDSPGFASSRLGVALGLEAIRMVEEGVAAPDDIDAAMTLGYKHPVGPLRLTDLVGLDVRLGVAEYLESKLGPRFTPPQLMRDMVARGDLGRKTGRGFYDWAD